MIRYVNKIEMVEAREISSAIVINKSGISLPQGVEFVTLDTAGLSAIEISDKISNKERVFTTKMVAFLPKRPEIGNKKLCFRITTVQNERFMIGTGVRPFPVIELSDAYPNVPSSKCGCTMTVTYTNIIPMLSVLV